MAPEPEDHVLLEWNSTPGHRDHSSGVPISEIRVFTQNQRLYIRVVWAAGSRCVGLDPPPDHGCVG